jgi:outer membrane biosynthesis protein TonB
LVVSIGRGHTGAYRTAMSRSLVTMTIASGKPGRAANIDPDASPAPRTAAKRTMRPAARAAVGAPRPAAHEAEAETPADFTGVTLTNDGPGAGWAAPTGSGGPIRGPLGTPGARVTGRSRTGATSGAGPSSGTDGAAVVALADLSKPPRPPVLGEMLERNYPDEARKRGLPGKAVMRLRVMPDGHLRDLIVVAESQGGFGEACRRTLRDSVWSPPFDLEAHPVSAFVVYTCTFTVH